MFFVLTACAVETNSTNRSARSKELLPHVDPAKAAALSEQYMTLLQQGDTEGAKALTCYPGHFAQSPFLALTVNSSEVMNAPTPGVRSLQDRSVGYTRVDILVNQASPSYILSVWNPDDHYKASQAEDSEWRAIGGNHKFGDDRADWSQASECVDDREMYAHAKQIVPGLSKAEIDTIMRGSSGQAVGESIYVWKDPTSRTARRVAFKNGKSSVISTVAY